MPHQPIMYWKIPEPPIGAHVRTIPPVSIKAEDYLVTVKLEQRIIK